MKQRIKTFLIWLMSLIHRDTSHKVVFYHDIGTAYTPMGTPDSLFRSHMAYLQELKQRAKEGDQFHCPPPLTFSTSDFHEVAFDDGFKGLWDHREILRQYDIHPIVFLAVALVGQPGYLTWDEIRALQNDYGVNFQCHTWSHQTLIGPANTDLSIPVNPNFRTDDWYHHELVDSKNELERQLNLSLPTTHQPPTTRHEVTSLCFPVGYFSDDVIKRCVVAGYTKLYASFPGNKDGANSIVHLHRLSPSISLIPRCLCQSSSLVEFKAILAGGLNGLAKRYLGRHLIQEVT